MRIRVRDSEASQDRRECFVLACVVRLHVVYAWAARGYGDHERGYLLQQPLGCLDIRDGGVPSADCVDGRSVERAVIIHGVIKVIEVDHLYAPSGLLSPVVRCQPT
jgi:hypothetical protein